jgi:hypothetical protein
MPRIVEDRLRFPLLHDKPVLHHADPVGDPPHDPEVMGDEQKAHAEVALQLRQELEDLRLDRDVERGGRFVGDQKLGVVGQRHGDHHALPLPAGQLVGIGAQPLLRVADAHTGHQLDDPLPRRLPAQALVQRKALGDLLFQRVQRVERCHRLLEDEADVVAPDLRNSASDAPSISAPS